MKRSPCGLYTDRGKPFDKPPPETKLIIWLVLTTKTTATEITRYLRLMHKTSLSARSIAQIVTGGVCMEEWYEVRKQYEQTH